MHHTVVADAAVVIVTPLPWTQSRPTSPLLMKIYAHIILSRLAKGDAKSEIFIMF